MSMEVREYFGTLKFIGNFNVAIGWLVVVGSIAIGIITFDDFYDPMITGAIIAVGAILGIIIVAQGQLLLVVHGIERNTRASAMSAGVPEQKLVGGTSSHGSKPGSVAAPVARGVRSEQDPGPFEKDW
jgi:hypothetical protein